MKPPSPKGVTVTCRPLGGARTSFPGETVRFRPAAYGVLIHNGRMLLARSRFTERWEAPGGAFEPWEPIQEGLAREFHEETGQTVEAGRLVDFRDDFVAFFDHPFHSLRFFLLVAPVELAPLLPDASEVSDLDWMDHDAIAALDAEAITDEDRRLFLRCLSESAS